MGKNARRRTDDLFEREGARLWRAVLAYTGDRELANDAVAEAFAQDLRRPGRARQPVKWIWRTAFRLAAAETAGRARFADMAANDLASPSEQAGLDDPSGALMSGLRRLPPVQRGPLVLRYYAGYRSGDAARFLGSTPVAVWVRLGLARRRLRRALGESARGLMDRFLALDRVPAPDLWRRIERRRPADLSVGASRKWKRIGAGIALILVAIAVALAARVLASHA